MIITCALTLLWYCVSPPQRATQASTRHSLGTSSAQSVHRTVSASQTALLCVAVRRAFTGLRKIHQLWPAHVSLTPQMQNHPITSLAVLIPLDVQRIQQSSSAVLPAVACVKYILLSCLVSFVIQRLSLRLHICIKLQFSRTNSALIKKPFSCQ